MDNKSLFSLIETTGDIEKLKEFKSGVMNFFSTSRRQVLTYCIYKNSLFIGTDDSLILVYSFPNDRVRLEIKDLQSNSYNLVQLEVFYEIKNFDHQDLLIALCEKNLCFIDLNSFKITLTIDLKILSFKMSINYENRLPLINVSNKQGFVINSIDNNFNIKKLIDVNDLDVSINWGKACFFGNNHTIIETKNKLLIYKMQLFGDNKEGLFTEELINNTQIDKYKLDHKLKVLLDLTAINNDLNKKTLNDINYYFLSNPQYLSLIKNDKIKALEGENSNKDKFKCQYKIINVSKKDSSIYKPDLKFNEFKYYNITTLITYSHLTNYIYLGIYNKIIIVKNTFTDYLGEEFKIQEKINNVSILTDLKVIDPYLLYIIDNKLYIHSVIDLELPLETINFPYPKIGYEYNLIKLLYLNRIDFLNNFICYADTLLMSRLHDSNPQYSDDKENLLCYARNLFIQCDVTNCKFIFYYSKLFTSETAVLKTLSKSTYCNYLAMLNSHSTNTYKQIILEDQLQTVYKDIIDHRKSSNNINFTNMIKSNFKVFQSKSLDFLFEEIKYENYEICKAFLDKSNLDMIYLFNSLRNFIFAKEILSLLDRIYKFISFDSFLYNNFIIEHDNKLICFIKGLINKIVSYRNDLKKQIPKSIRKLLNYDSIFSQKITGSDNEDDVFVKSLKECINSEEINLFLLFPSISGLNNNYDIKILCIKYILVENIILMLNIHSIGLIKHSKFRENLRLIIKQSISLINVEYIELLYKYNLFEEIILFLYFKGKYSECFLRISKLFDLKKEEDLIIFSSKFIQTVDTINSNQIKKNEKRDAKSSISFGKSDEDSILFVDYINNILSDQSEKEKDVDEDLNTAQINTWFVKYLNLLVLIERSISNFEFFEFIKWPLSQNTLMTLKILKYKNSIHLNSINNDFIIILKEINIDAVLDYFEIFMEDNKFQRENIEEIVKLLLLKLITLYDEDKLNKHMENKINSTRIKLINILIEINIKSNNRESESYLNIKNMINEFKCKDLKSEKGVLMIKDNLNEEGISKILEEDTIYYLDILKKLVKEMPSLDLIITILNNLNIKLDGKKSKSNIKIYNEFILSVLTILRDNNQYTILKNLFANHAFNNLCPEEIIDFCIILFSQMQNQINSYKIEASLAENRLLKHYEDLYDFENQRISSESLSYCSICKKGIFELEFYCLEDLVFHCDCYNKENKNKNE